jgi:hypothetical protein
VILGAKLGETWNTVNQAVIDRKRGLTGYGSLAQLLAWERGVKNRKAQPPLTEAKIGSLAQAYYRQIGRWPGHTDGKIPGSGGETWSSVHSALRVGGRGLPGGSSLYQLQLQHGRKVRLQRPASRRASRSSAASPT